MIVPDPFGGDHFELAAGEPQHFTDLIAANSHPARLGRAKWPQKLLPDKLVIHPGTRIDDIDRDLTTVSTGSNNYIGWRLGSFSSIVDQVRQYRTELVPVDRHLAIASIQPCLDRHSERVQLLRQIGDHGIWFDYLRRRLSCPGAHLLEQTVHSRHRAFKRLQHIAAELGIVHMAARIRDDHPELAGQILEIVNHEREALAEIVQYAAVAQRARRALLGKVAGRLTPGRAKQVECLPIEAVTVWRRSQSDKGNQRLAMRQRNRHPGVGRVEGPSLIRRRRPLLNPGAVAKTGEECCPAGSLMPCSTDRFHAACGTKPRPSCEHQSDPAGLSTICARALTTRTWSVSPVDTGLRHGFDKTEPLRPVIEAMAVEMPRDKPLQMHAQIARSDGPRPERRRFRPA